MNIAGLSIRSRITTAVVVASVVLAALVLAPATAAAQAYTTNRTLRLTEASRLLTMALALNKEALAKIQALNDPASPEIPGIIQLLHQAYDLQARSTTPVDGIIRASRLVPEPLLERYSTLTSTASKPATMRAAGALAAGQIQEAMGHLTAAIAVQTEQLELLF